MIRANAGSISVTKKTDSVRHKELGLAHLFYRGTHKETEAITISADVLFNDEYDRSNIAVIETFGSRLDRSNFRRTFIFSNPTVPNYGVDYMYKKSNQFHWFVKCEHCGKWQYLRYPDSLDFDKAKFICIKCKKEITDETRRDGIWVAKYRNRSINGYWLSQLFCTWHDAESIIKKSKQKKDVFYNFTLGLPYQGSDITIKSQHILRCINKNVIKPGVRAMGIDQGGTFYITVGTVDGIERIYTAGSWEEVKKEIGKYQPNICVIDGLPETNEVKKLQEYFKGPVSVYPAFYKDKPDDPRTVRWERPSVDRRTAAVYIDRFRSIEGLVQDIYKGEIKFYLDDDDPNIDLLVKHFESIYRVEEINKAGQTYYAWRSSNKQDHFVHSLNYYRVALERISHLKRMDIEDGEDDRPYPGYESPEERLRRYDKDYYEAHGIPEYILRGENDGYLNKK
jgi:hypothetical protein